MIGLIFFIGEADRKEYNKTHKHHNYHNLDNYNNYYNNSFYNNNSEWAQKRRNGGITDEELKLRKKMIRSNLKNKKIKVK